MKDAVFTYLSDKSPVLGAIIVTGAVVWWAAVFYFRMRRTSHDVEFLQIEVREGAAKMENKMQDITVKMEQKIDGAISNLKENDLFHLGKALLIGFSESLKNNPERFERMKDVILESTPDNKKDEIKSITI